MKKAQEAVAFSKRELLSLLGHLNFAMRVIPQGRSFISRLLDLSKSVEKLHDIIIIIIHFISKRLSRHSRTLYSLKQEQTIAKPLKVQVKHSDNYNENAVLKRWVLREDLN